MITNLRYEWDKLLIFFPLSGMKYPSYILAPTFSTVSLVIIDFEVGTIPKCGFNRHIIPFLSQ